MDLLTSIFDPLNPLVVLVSVIVSLRSRRSGLWLIVLLGLVPAIQLLRLLDAELLGALLALRGAWEYPVHFLLHVLLGSFLWARAKERKLSVDELGVGRFEDEVRPDRLVVHEHWARGQLQAAEPFWATLFPPRISSRFVWVIDATCTSGERLVRLVSEGAPVPTALEGEIAAPLSMSGRRLPADAEVQNLGYRSNARQDLEPALAKALAALRTERELVSVRAARWPLLVLKPRWPFTEPYFAFLGPGGQPGFLRLIPKHVGDHLLDMT